eukprot:TRINITY_DN4335_c0_g1_i2.p1 TRINITY_DN4335_c0_g1~~TRINITY_DN4335_c0_g1_i2.p1  ORF type:complete len:162 (-),score=42.39 TRINITY_DN4335_c0_g1_i2:322-807(-)
MLQGKARVLCKDGYRASECSSKELPFELELSRKKRVDVKADHGGNRGAKCFSNPEYSKGYWAQEGINPTLQMRLRPKHPVVTTHTFEATEEMLNFLPPPRPSFNQKQTANALRDDTNTVSLLPSPTRVNVLSKYASLMAAGVHTKPEDAAPSKAKAKPKKK